MCIIYIFMTGKKLADSQLPATEVAGLPRVSLKLKVGTSVLAD